MISRRFISMILIVLASGASLPGQVFFLEDFSDNSAGWTPGTTWQIGPAMAGTTTAGNPDPSTDTTPTADNGVAGVVIGGNAPIIVHTQYYFTSPVINAVASPLMLTYKRWLNSDYPPYMTSVVEVFNGSSWTTVWTNVPGVSILDNSWQSIAINITAYGNANLQIRFGYNVGSTGVFSVSSWNIDDVEVSGPCPPIQSWPDVDGDGFGNTASPFSGCTIPPGHVTVAGDCDDNNAAVNPLATEVCNGIDDDCDTVVDEGVPAVAQTYGVSCPVSSVLLSSNAPVLGQTLNVTVSGSLANAPGILLVSGPVAPPYPVLPGGCELYLANAGILLLGGMATDAGGNWLLSVPVPSDPVFNCVHFALQIVFPTLTGLQVTNGLLLRLGS